jgi:FAD/FMN-containing dehydrogenase
MFRAQINGASPVSRRTFLQAGAALGAAAFAPAPPAFAAPRVSRVRADSPAWPKAADWEGLNRLTNGNLSPVSMPDLSDPAIRKLVTNPFWVGEHPALTQSSGWLDAWRSAPSNYMVTAHSAQDVAQAVRFARAHNLRLVVRGGGHSYLGQSNAPDSLMIWTRRLDEITVHDAFVPKGSNAKPVPAMSVGAGAIWLRAYQAAAQANRYVQGGGCTTVGVAGLVQGNGFGSFSKRYGTVGSSLLEAEIVTSDGQVRIVNQAREPDLFWALKGGGGGTWGVVTQVTLATHDLPETVGGFNLTIRAKSDEAYRRLLARFVDLYRTNLFNPHWGEQVSARPDNKLEVSMVFQDLTPAQAREAWKPLLDFCDASPADYEGQNGVLAISVPGRGFWDADYMKAHLPPAIRPDLQPGARPTDFWWAGDSDQVGAYWYAYTSAWLPQSLLKPENQARLVDAWFAASRKHSASFHFNKGIAGAPPEAVARARQTPTNPAVADAFALCIIAGATGPAFPGFPQPNLAYGKVDRDRVHAAMDALLACAPGAGSYVNETDWFQPDWQRAFWGPNYQRLLAIKRRYDPAGLFTVHHGVGSEGWSDDGFVKA